MIINAQIYLYRKENPCILLFDGISTGGCYSGGQG